MESCSGFAQLTESSVCLVHQAPLASPGIVRVVTSPSLPSRPLFQSTRQDSFWMSGENLSSTKKTERKSTYPPPADGPCVLFLCKSGCSANEPAAQAGRGALQPIGNCTECKVLKGSAARLHRGVQDGRGGDSGEVLGFIGRKI